METEDAIKSFKIKLSEEDMTEGTIETYCHHIKKYLEYCSTNDYKHNDLDVLKKYIEEFKEKEKSNSTINLAISALRIFAKHILGDISLCTKSQRPKVESTSFIQFLDKDTIKSIINLTEKDKYKIIFSLMYGSGLRLKEVVKLRKSDIDLDEKIVYIRGKGPRVTILSKTSERLLKEYLIRFASLCYIFPGGGDNPYLSPRQIQREFKVSLSKTGSCEDASVSCLRNSFIVHLLEKEVDSFKIRKTVGMSTEGFKRYVKAVRENVASQTIKSPLD